MKMVVPTFNSLLMRLVDKLIVSVKASSSIIICSQKQLNITFSRRIKFLLGLEFPIAPKKFPCSTQTLTKTLKKQALTLQIPV